MRGCSKMIAIAMYSLVLINSGGEPEVIKRRMHADRNDSSNVRVMRYFCHRREAASGRIPICDTVGLYNRL